MRTPQNAVPPQENLDVRAQMHVYKIAQWREAASLCDLQHECDERVDKCADPELCAAPLDDELRQVLRESSEHILGEPNNVQNC